MNFLAVDDALTREGTLCRPRRLFGAEWGTGVTAAHPKASGLPEVRISERLQVTLSPPSLGHLARAYFLYPYGVRNADG